MPAFKLHIDGLSCAGCVGRAERALAATPGVASASVNLATKSAHVDATDAALDAILTALETAGYPARKIEITLTVGNLNCASCSARAESALLAVPGVTEANVNFATGKAWVTYVDGMTDPTALAQAVTEAGYPAQTTTTAAPETADEQGQTFRSFVIATVLTLPVFVTEMGGHVFPPFHHWLHSTIGQTNLWLMQFLLTTLVLLWPGRVFYRIGVPALLKRQPEMNSLVVLGATAAWAYSTAVLLVPQVFPANARFVYFEAAAVIVTLILLGRWLESRAKGQAGAAIEALINLRPETALVERDGQPQPCPIDQIRIGDRIHLKPGERVAVDGVILSGSSYLDESMITGEPAPVARAAGDPVIGGTINGAGALIVEATHVGGDTVLARIVELVETAQGAKLPVQALADRVVAYFVPAVLGVAALTILIWLVFGPSLGLAMLAGVSVLIIACPCAMGLATPMSIMVGTGRAAEMGVFFRRGEALQRLSDVSVIAFDKTGTLTVGQPAVTDSAFARPEKSEAALALFAAVEAQSEHPAAGAIMDLAQGQPLPDAHDVTAVAGRGIRGRVAGHEIAIGTELFLREEGIEPDTLALDAEGGSLIYGAIDGQLAAVFAVDDQVKDSSIEVIAALHRAGLKTAMISGDAPEPARRVAASLGIDEVIAGVLPEGKVQALADLQATHGTVAFVGDGINDAPALAHADVGIALGTGTDVSIETADIVLISDDLAGVANAWTISRHTLRNIRQNLFWAFAYNTALIPVAAGLLYPIGGVMLSPMLAAGAMALSSVFVVSNALRLRRVARVI